MKAVLAGLRAGALAAALAAPASAVDEYKAWSYSRRIAFNTTATGAGVAGAVGDFPLCIRLTRASGGEAFSQAQPGGADIRFSDPDGTPLAYEIERWDSAKGLAEIWVKVPKVEGNSASDYITLHWGKPGALSESDGKRVFAAAAGFQGVWHLASGGTGPRPNSVADSNDATPVNYDGDESRPGVIGLADSLGGGKTAGDYLDLGPGFEDFTGGITFSIWACPTRPWFFARFFDLGNGESMDNVLFSTADTTRQVYFQVVGETGLKYRLYSAQVLEDAVWQHYAATVQGTAVVIYRNGLPIKEGQLDVPIHKLLRTKNYIGRPNWLYNDFFEGKIDEPRISRVPRSADWVKLGYEAERSGSKLISLGPVVSSRLEITSQAIGTFTAMEGAPVTLKVTAVSTRPITYQWQRDGKVVVANTTGTHAIPSVATAHAGIYRCRVADGQDTVFSGDYILKVTENPALWGNSMAIKVDTRTAAGNVAVDVDDFPLLIRLDQARFDFTKAAADGSDLRFIDAAGSFLPYQIARWSPLLKQAEIWVRLPLVKGGAETALTMLWGRSGVPAASSGSAVFPPSAGWRGAYHLDEAVGITGAADASGNGHAGIVTGAASNESGLAGQGFRFAGGADRIQLPDAATSGIKSFTFTLWVKETKAADCTQDWLCPTLTGMETSGSQSRDLIIYSKNGKLGFIHGFSGTFNVDPDAFSRTEISLNDGKWHHVGLIYDGRSMVLFEGGTPVASQDALSDGMAVPGFDIGNSHWSGDLHKYGFTGAIDEYGIAAVARTGEWIRLAYETQREDGKAVIYGASAAQPLPPPTAYPPAGTHSAPLTVTLSAVSGATIRYTTDGSDPINGEGSIYAYSRPITLARDGVIRAVAMRDGKMSVELIAEYKLIRSLPIGGTDTLAPGDTVGVGGGRWLVAPKTPGAPNLALELKPAPAAFESGFDLAGPLLHVAPAPGASASGGLEVAGGMGPEAGVAVFRVGSDGGITRLEPKEGALWIPGPGDYVIARDISAPRLAWLGSAVSGDSVRIAFRVLDNVRNPRWRMRWLAGSKDSTAWAECLSGDSLWRRLPVPAGSADPVEIRLSATDLVSTAHFPARDDRVFTVARPLPAAAPIALPGGSAWTLAGLPADTTVRVTLDDLAGANAGGKLHVAVWEDNPAARGTGSYRRLSVGEALPTGQALWLAADSRLAALALPASQTAPSDTLGTFPIRLGPGWNLVANPSLRALPWPIPRQAVETYALSPVKGLHAQDGEGYAPADTLAPWMGYYVFNHGGDTVIRVGGDLPPVLPKAAGKTSRRVDLVLSGSRGAAGSVPSVRLGARAWASDGLGSEDDFAPPPRQGQGRGLWSARGGRALSADFVSWSASGAAQWTVIARGEAGLRVDGNASAWPADWQVWAAFPSRGLKLRLDGAAGFPVQGEDTVALFAGTPSALAALPGLQGLEAAPSRFRQEFRRGTRGWELHLDLPAAAQITLRLYRADGSGLGGWTSREAGAGRHTWSLPFPPGLAPGMVLTDLRVEGGTWSLRRAGKIAGFAAE